MSADMLREAATLMRERAEAATQGPWFVEEVGDFGDKSASLPIGRWRGMTDNVSFGEDFATAEHIASWHPAVALAVADWLDSAAREHDEDECYRLAPPNGCHEARRALAVARAYLGRAAS